MFKKLKQKISEEQTSGRGSPAGSTSAFPQRSSESSALSPSIHRNRTSSLTEQNYDSTSTPNRELLAGMITEPAFLSEYTVFALDPTKRPKPKSECVIIYKQNSSNNESEPSSPVEVKMDQKTKRHLQEEFAASLEEKDQIISVLQTQVSLLKQQLHSNETNIELPNPNVQTQSQVQSPVKDQNMENTLQSVGPVGNENADKTIESLTQRVKHQENLLHQCKERIKSQKERLAQLTSEKEVLQEQLYERLQELEKIKDCHMAEKTKFITQLRESKNLIEQLEQDKGMVIAETKRQMHETLELKEEEIAQLHIHIKQMVLQSKELKKQKDKSEKSAFEQLEKALSAAQMAEEAHKKLQAEMDEKIKAIEKANEEKCVSLQQELTRMKQEVKKCQKNHLWAMKEKEQQNLLALEEIELQKKALQSECNKKLEDMQLEVETFQTRILELESSLMKCPQNDKSRLEELTTQIDSDKNEHNKKIATMTEKHKKEIEYTKQQEQQHWKEQFDILTQQQQSEMEKLSKHHEEETAKLLKEKEAIFHAHIEEMNEKTLEKLDVKQTELEALSSELSDVLNSRQNLEQYISKLKEDANKAKVEFEAKLDQQRNNHKEQIEAIFKDQEVTEKSFKEEIIQLKQFLEAKEKSEEESEQKKMKETLGKAESQCKRMSAELDVLCQSREDNASIYENKFKNLQEKLEVIKDKKSKLEEQVVKTETQLNEIKTELDFQTSQVNELKCELEEEKRKNIQNTSFLTEKYESQLRNLGGEISQLKSHCTGKESEIGQIKHLLNQQIEKYRQQLSIKKEEMNVLRDEYELKLKQQETQTEEAIEKIKNMQEEFKQKLSEQEAKLKSEIESNQLEFSQKEKQFTSEMLEMTHASSLGINDAVLKLEMNQKEQLKSMAEAHKQEVGEVVHLSEKKLKQEVEERQEKHETELQEKEQEIRDLKEKLATFDAEREGNNAEITWLKDEHTKKDKTIHELQEQLQETLAQVNLLTQKESDLKKQLVKLENDLSFSLKEKITVQEQLNEIKLIEEKKKYDIVELADKLKMSDAEYQALKLSHLKEQENYETKLEREKNEFRQKQAEFENFKRDIITKLADYQQKEEALLKIKIGELVKQCSEKISSITVKIAHCQQQIIKIKEDILIKVDQVPDLKVQLEQLTESHVTLNSSLQESKKHLEEKEYLMMSMKADVDKLLTEKELLEKESYLQQQTATEKESCITELKKELSEYSNIVTSMREELNEKKAEITDLNKLISELNLRLEKSISEKETATMMLNKQHRENQLQLLNEMEVLSSKVESLSEDKVTALKQVDHWVNKMSEWKKKAQLRFTQNYNTIKELQSKIELSNNQASEKEEELNRIKDEHDKQTKQLEHLKCLMEQKQVRKEKQESDLVAEIKIHTARIAELEEHIARKTEENDYLMGECKIYHEQDNEQKEMAQQLQQARKALVDKDDNLKEMEQNVLTFEKKMQVMEIVLEEKSKEFEGIKLALLKTKEEELKALEERLISEATSKIADLKKKAEHKIASIKRQLTTQVEEKEQQNKLQKKLEEKEKKIMSLEEKIKSIDSDLEKELIKKVETIKVSAEQDKVIALENMQQMYDLKINILKKDLLDKERLLEKYSEEANTYNISKMKAQEQQEELLKRSQEDKNKIKNLQQELEEQIKKQASLHEQHIKYESELRNIKVELKNKEQNMEIAIKDLEKKLQEKEEKGQSFGEDFMKEREQQRIEMENRISEYNEKLKSLQEQLDEGSGLIKTLEGNIEEKTKSVFELQKMVNELQMQQKDLQATLKQTEQEKQEQHRDLIKLQKDLRTLRKEHQQELEIMKKESREEMEQKIKYEQEDIELKHNSTLKQLMREFNTQLAQKDQELEMAVKETISKAQEVESELIESHHTETVQLHKKISEKDDDLQRTVKKYEDILEAREEEMTKKVNKLEEQLVHLKEDYKKRLAYEESRNGDEENIAELQAQLAQKTTLVNDSKLKEQEFREQIHILQDKLKNYEKAVYVTTVKTPYRDGNLCHSDVSLFGEPTEFEYLRKVVFEYMMGRETKTMAKVITSVLKFPPDQTQKILERENARTLGLGWCPKGRF
ncbi:golgin subfamily A member 4-like isoform X4 [Crotalus tigris]|uniref:golgin subfamily A member 4-like isoform X4 n=1 Tax=Crotalus tigris TaxID=88082 RepID=UPI00192F95FF|nr:golgin subfamily A member 4-like isoform X4 [Crotalus tigris]